MHYLGKPGPITLNSTEKKNGWASPCWPYFFFPLLISLVLIFFFFQIRLNASGSVSTEQFQNMSIINGLYSELFNLVPGRSHHLTSPSLSPPRQTQETGSKLRRRAWSDSLCPPVKFEMVWCVQEEHLQLTKAESADRKVLCKWPLA